MPEPIANATQTGSMRQIIELPTTPESGNASTCGFFARKGRCARGFWNLPHTSVRQFRKCGENRRTADQTPVLRFRDLWFCCQKPGCARRLPIFPRTSGKQPRPWRSRHLKVQQSAYGLFTLKGHIAICRQFGRKDSGQRKRPHRRKPSNNHQIALRMGICHRNGI